MCIKLRRILRIECVIKTELRVFGYRSCGEIKATVTETPLIIIAYLFSDWGSGGTDPLNLNIYTKSK